MTEPKTITTIACVGEVMLEFSPLADESYQLGVAGDSFNTAVYVKRLWPTGDVAYVTAVGQDQPSERVLTALENHNLNTRLVERRKDSSVGLYVVTLAADGERSFSYWRSASAARTLFSPPWQEALDKLRKYDLVYLSGISIAILPAAVRQQLLEWIDDYRAAGGLFAFDSNYRPALWESVETARESTMAMWQRCDVALPSVDDEQLLFEDADEAAVMQRLRQVGVNYGALKRGADGPIGFDGSTLPADQQLPVKVVDSTAAGDSFNAGFLAAYAQNQSLLECMGSGHNLAAQVVQYRGAITPS